MPSAWVVRQRFSSPWRQKAHSPQPKLGARKTRVPSGGRPPAATTSAPAPTSTSRPTISWPGTRSVTPGVRAVLALEDPDVGPAQAGALHGDPGLARAEGHRRPVLHLEPAGPGVDERPHAVATASCCQVGTPSSAPTSLEGDGPPLEQRARPGQDEGDRLGALGGADADGCPVHRRDELDHLGRVRLGEAVPPGPVEGVPRLPRAGQHGGEPAGPGAADLQQAVRGDDLDPGVVAVVRPGRRRSRRPARPRRT